MNNPLKFIRLIKNEASLLQKCFRILIQKIGEAIQKLDIKEDQNEFNEPWKDERLIQLKAWLQENLSLDTLKSMFELTEISNAPNRK